MAQIEGLQVNIVGKTDQLQKSLEDVKKSLSSVAQESQRQADNISNPLKKAADDIAGRYGWAAGEVATKLASMANPAALVASAIGLAVAGIGAYVSSLSQNVASTEDVIKEHTKLIKDIKESYEAASEGAKRYGLDLQDVLVARNRVAIINLEDQLKQLSREIVSTFTTAAPATSQWSNSLDRVFGSIVVARRELIPFGEAINNFNMSIRAGEPDIVAFRSQLSAVMNAAADNRELQKLGGELLKAAEQAFNVSGKLGQARDEMNGVAGAARNAATATEAFNAAMRELAAIEPAKIDDITRANNILNDALRNQNLTLEQQKALRDANAAAIARSEKASADAAAAEAKRAAEQAAAEEKRNAEKLTREQDAITKRLETMVTGWGTEEEQLAAHLTRNQDLIAQARAKEVIDDQTHKILMLGAEEEYQKKIQTIRDNVNNQALSSTANMFGSLQRLTETYGKKGTALAKAFGIAQALINTYVGVTKALSTLPPPASYAAAAATLAAGMAQVASISSVSDTGKGAKGAASSGGGALSAAGAAAGGGGNQPGGNSVYINLQGQSFGRDQVRDLVKQIADFQKDGGQVVFA